MTDTSIRVSHTLADELHDRKDRGDSYEDVIWRLVEGEDTDSGPDDGLRDAVDGIDWGGQGGAKNDERVEAVAAAAALLRDRGECAPVVLRRHVDREYDLGLQQSSVQRLLSDNLPKMPAIETESNGQIYVWRDQCN